VIVPLHFATIGFNGAKMQSPGTLAPGTLDGLLKTLIAGL